MRPPAKAAGEHRLAKIEGFGEKTEENPWHATTIEWAAPSPPPHGNFLVAPEAYRGPYEYSVPGAAKDYTPQYEA